MASEEHKDRPAENKNPSGENKSLSGENKDSSTEHEDRYKQADDAIRRTAQSYVEKSPVKVDLNQIEKFANEKPLTFLGIGAGVGFFLGGGLQTKIGLTLLALFGRRAAKQTAVNLASDWMRGSQASRSMQGRNRFGSGMRAR